MAHRYISMSIVMIGLFLVAACANGNGMEDEPPVETIEGTPIEPDDEIPPLTAEELDRFQQEIRVQYQLIDRAYERLDEAYEEAFEEGVLETPEDIREQHERLARRHENIAQMHEDRIQLMLDVPEVMQSDLELVEINGMLAARHRDIAGERLLDDMPVQVFHLRQELMTARGHMMELHPPVEEDAFEEPEDEAGDDPDMPGAPRQPGFP